MVGRIISEQEEEKIVNFGALRYPAEKMANVLGWELGDVKNEMADTGSQFFLLYSKGKDISDYLLDKKLFELAKAGDMKAMDRYKDKILVRNIPIKT